MAKNCRFAVAVHVMAVLASMDKEGPVTSDFIAGSVNTNPVVVRRILSALAKAGLVTSQRGTMGGSVLAVRPDQVTLLEISRAVDEDEDPPLHNQPPSQACPVGRGILPVLTRILTEAEAAKESILARITLAEVVTEVHRAAS